MQTPAKRQARKHIGEDEQARALLNAAIYAHIESVVICSSHYIVYSIHKAYARRSVLRIKSIHMPRHAVALVVLLIFGSATQHRLQQ